MVAADRLILRQLIFTGAKVLPAELRLTSGTNLIWGASNTGKSFALKAFDFMLGGETPLPSFQERDGYDKIWLGLSVGTTGDFTLSRATIGGGFTLFEGLLSGPSEKLPVRKLSAKHEADSDDSVSSFLLSRIGLGGKRVASTSSGTTQNLTFRAIARLILADETTIQAEHSPIQGGQRHSASAERSVFRLMLTGLDDAALVALPDRKTVKAARVTKLEMLDEMLAEVDAELREAFPESAELPAKENQITIALDSLRQDLELAQASALEALRSKQRVARDLSSTGTRLSEIELHLERFSQLAAIYDSDVARLDALEEAGFLLSLTAGRPCALCGALPENQQHQHETSNVEQVREAALAEIGKIKKQRLDLGLTVTQLNDERADLETSIHDLKKRLMRAEDEIQKVAPRLHEHQQSVTQILAVRDHVRRGLGLLEHRAALLLRRQAVERLKGPKAGDKPKLVPPSTAAHDFCKVVSSVLTQWDFPGERQVSFDEKSYDIRIDGKLRTDNGKGVRAVTHAAFKVALLLYCHQHQLPHPGVVVLDTPLLTYRDPLRSPKFGALTEDERELAKTSLKQRFFEHLFELRDMGQFIVLENVDPPDNIRDLANVQLFSGSPGKDRSGLFPTPPGGSSS